MDEKKYTYILVIEYIEGEDRCEYIKETVTEPEDDVNLEIGSYDLNDYFDQADIDVLTSYEIAKT
tara:strand:- start:23 stop:217 length:195 start_codon:yes stop_codon:yes gene_type:complete